MIACETYKIGDWTAKKAESEIENGIEEQKKVVRYNLESIDGNYYTIWDNQENKRFEIKGDKKWYKFREENKGDWTTAF